ncbi:MAG TPA: nicotinate-nucleotide--dimethylbenzimidazole phosphoribosyltransferase [Solirubrobacteraceae bacterium]|nr:nicotinate-nucleotide--dimethylbenzimidazole phosphoribosyltransferase [Solirubrobacteraceae bacterium]
MSAQERFLRPPVPAGFDRSRALERAAQPTGWRFSEEQRSAVHRVIAERRDVRSFRSEEVPDEVLERVLAAAHRAPSVGLMQPWRLIVIRDPATRSAMRMLAQRERLRQAQRFGERAAEFLDKKIEGVLEAPIGICVCCDHGSGEVEVLGRATIPQTDIYSTCCAIENLWLAARAEGLGVGWVSFYRPEDLRELLGIPERADPVAWLCLGWPDERPLRPSLEASGWSRRVPLSAVLMDERWREPGREQDSVGQGGARPGGHVASFDRQAAVRARDRLDRLVKPAGSLGLLEALIERWAGVTGALPPERVRAGVAVCAADHGHLRHGTSLFDQAVSAQVAAAAARGESAVAVLARREGHELIVADLGLAAPTPPGVREMKIAPGSADMTEREALDDEQLERALAAGASLAGELARRGCDCLVLGEIGIGNTTTAAALACALTGEPPERMVGRGSGLDAAGLDRKRALVARALQRHGGRLDGRAALRALGGLELAGIAGAISAAAHLRLPVVLDGFAVCAAALAAVREKPALAEILIGGHRSAEVGHGLLLHELGLEPLLDLRLRLGEASGALLALSLIGAAGSLGRQMGSFVEAEDERRLRAR